MIRAHDLTPPLIALLAAAGLGGLVLIMTLMPSATLPMSADVDASLPPRLEKPQALRLPAFKSYAVIADRPLFNAGRAKDILAAEQSALQQSLPRLSDYRLVGLVVSSGTQRALVGRPSGDVVMLKPGDDLDGRRVLSIDPRGVSLSSVGHDERLVFSPAQASRSAQELAATGGSTQANR